MEKASPKQPEWNKRCFSVEQCIDLQNRDGDKQNRCETKSSVHEQLGVSTSCDLSEKNMNRKWNDQGQGKWPAQKTSHGGCQHCQGKVSFFRNHRLGVHVVEKLKTLILTIAAVATRVRIMLNELGSKLIDAWDIPGLTAWKMRNQFDRSLEMYFKVLARWISAAAVDRAIVSLTR
ncbi:hypothetical protein OGAPHI_006892 [Ogataea philodendri]|uniref:Uncharacterized protein n=1 Tax=Ogataea philodendri TaxID=1378263 RepID=A0A9P8T072_9ASCO|nr:uncharacterized protein OGAPHI_006892 [Ogataea philodendri]KAH3660306.1 hypothetical protein OGAPHI_006892 [Ogataea philodendri]